MNKRPARTDDDLRSAMDRLRTTALAALTERAKTDPEARKGLEKLRRKGVIPNA